MARELQVVPKKIQYVARQEQQLYETINEKFSEGDKKRELLKIMQEVLEEMRAEVNHMDWSVDDLPWHQDPRFIVSNSIFYSSSRSRSSPDALSLRVRGADLPSDGEEAVSYDSYNFDDYEIIRTNDESFAESYGKVKSPQPPDEDSPQFNNIRVENESEMFSLSTARGSWHSQLHSSGSATTCTNSVNISIKQASLDVQQTVFAKLSQKISLKLAKFVDCLKDTYFGTLQRCLESLESSCRQELGGRPASEAMRQLLSVARQVDLSPCATFPVLSSLLESLRRLLHKVPGVVVPPGAGRAAGQRGHAPAAVGGAPGGPVALRHLPGAQLSAGVAEEAAAQVSPHPCQVLESLESSCRQELGGRPASEAMRQLLSVARQVDLSPCATFPVLSSLLESLRRLLHK
ncbi:hypothetical protein PYW07_010997 [Mythimna separata]|uniref:Uncharacterized protein n=1 Tax=Mythimna separata TaxID=271217 RepID=A0AAD7Y781_MYTSE|nr:hypothetical protein PYW07_010997 [Mythimna separata]